MEQNGENPGADRGDFEKESSPTEITRVTQAQLLMKQKHDAAQKKADDVLKLIQSSFPPKSA
jgi:hypothetical protein